jgi:uncharacterized protein YchJ
MSSRESINRLIPLLMILIVSAFAQDAPETPQASVRRLIDGLQEAIGNGSPVDQFFSPSVRANEKAEIDALAKRGFLKFEIVDYTLKDLRLQDERHAALPVTVKWSTRTEEASRTTTLRFVKEQGAWYFEHADFWKVSLGWFFFPLIALAIAYGISAVVMNRHVQRQQWANPRRRMLWQALSIIPLSALVYFARKPWSRGGLAQPRA